jgi:hypothetical protein
MIDQSPASTESSKFNPQTLFTPHRMAMIIMWLVTTVVLVVMLFNGVRNTDQFESVCYLLQAAYVAAMLWFLVREGPAIDQLPEIKSAVLPRWRYGRWIPVVAIAIMLLLTMVSDDGVDLLLFLMMAFTVLALVVWRREIRLPLVWQGLAVAIVAFLGGLPAMKNGLIGAVTFYGLLIFVPLMYIVGSLLLRRTGLGGIQLADGWYVKALKSILWGCLMFVPLGLLNAASGSPGMDVEWVTKWWMPLTMPWFSGLAEEVWFRLLLVGLCYFLLRPAFRKYPALAVLAAVLFSAITFGLGHGRTLDKFLTTGLLYGLPMAVVFARRDWEHAAGAHYMINMIPWMMAFLEN